MTDQQQVRVPEIAALVSFNPDSHTLLDLWAQEARAMGQWGPLHRTLMMHRKILVVQRQEHVTIGSGRLSAYHC